MSDPIRAISQMAQSIAERDGDVSMVQRLQAGINAIDVRDGRPWTEAEQIRQAICGWGGRTLCLRCRCCEVEWHVCETCRGEGMIEIEDEDDAWNPDWKKCNRCRAEGGWPVCIGHCDEQGKHTCILE